jgi:pyrimidine operon attenuation protein/uracil phosphoribosyltransferase
LTTDARVTSSREIIEVKFREVDNDEQVLLVERVD